MNAKQSITLFLAVLYFCATAHAVTIDTVPIGNPGNAPDTRYDATGFGSVGYNYRIGKYEVTAGQYTEFLNAVAKDDTNGLYDLQMVRTYGANIQRTGSSPNYSYTVAALWANRPVNLVSFWDAARFANWLHNGQPTGPQGPGTTEDGAYANIGNQDTFARQAGAKFFIPTEDEWYKAAYHNKMAGLAASYFDYPTGTNSVPGTDLTEATNPGNNANYNYLNLPYDRTVIGEFEFSDSPYGTFDQAGNIAEWNETKLGTLQLGTLWRGLRGGSNFNFSNALHATTRYLGGAPDNFGSLVGFRVASIPEPSTLLLGAMATLGLLWQRRARIAHD